MSTACDGYRGATSGTAAATEDLAGATAAAPPAGEGYAAAGAHALNLRDLPGAGARPGRQRAAGRGGTHARLAQLPYLVVLACVACGFFVAWHGPSEVASGAEMAGGALLAAALARLVLPQQAAGLLASRRRAVDVLAFTVLGVGLLVIGLVLPPF